MLGGGVYCLCQMPSRRMGVRTKYAKCFIVDDQLRFDGAGRRGEAFGEWWN